MDNNEERVKSNIFAAELEQIFNLIITKLGDQEENETFAELRRCFPDHLLTYMWFCNLNMMEDEPNLPPQVSSHKSEYEELQE